MRPAQIDHWRSLNPALSISLSSKAYSDLPRIDDDRLLSFQRGFDREGYVHLHEALDESTLSVLAPAVEAIVKTGMPPVFAFVYDEPWMVFRRLSKIVEQILGAPSVMMPAFWVWYVDPRLKQSGWRPHRDYGHQALFPDRRPKSVNVWISITEATTLNGCMYVVPAEWDPTYGTERDKTFFFDHRSIRALPAKAGDAFIWNQALLHWGSRASEGAGGPRISMALEFQRADVAPFDTPLFDSQTIFSFDQRLALIAVQIQKYRHMYGELDLESATFAEAWAPRIQDLVKSSPDGLTACRLSRGEEQ